MMQSLDRLLDRALHEDLTDIHIRRDVLIVDCEYLLKLGQCIIVAIISASNQPQDVMSLRRIWRLCQSFLSGALSALGIRDVIKSNT